MNSYAPYRIWNDETDQNISRKRWVSLYAAESCTLKAEDKRNTNMVDSSNLDSSDKIKFIQYFGHVSRPRVP